MNKKGILVLILLSLLGFLFAGTPAIDGTFDGESVWGTPAATGDGNTGWAGVNLSNLYVTHDNTYAYFSGQAATGGAPGTWMRFGFAINTKVGGGSNDPWGGAVSFGYTNKPDYVLEGRKGDNWAELRVWNGSSWDGGGSNYSGANLMWSSDYSYVEGRILLATLGNPSTADVQFFVSGNNVTEHGNFDSVPTDPVMASWNNPTSLTNYATGLSLAVIVEHSFISVINQISPTTLEVKFNEAMDLDALAEVSNYSLDRGVSITAVDVVDAMTVRLTTGTLANATEYNLTLDDGILVAQSGHTLNPNSLGFTSLFYSTISFSLNMNVMIVQGNFDPATEIVAVRGGFNSWGTTNLSDTNSDGIYTATLTLPLSPGNSFDYKYWTNRSDNYESIANRSYTVVDGTNSIPSVYFNDIDFSSFLSREVKVTFQLNVGAMPTNLYASGISIQGSRAPLNWTAGSTLMADPNNDKIYTVDVTFPAGSLKNLDYKFTRAADSTAWGWEEAQNRTLTLSDETTTMLAPVQYWQNAYVNELTGVVFFDNTVSTFTNFANGGSVETGSSLNFEAEVAGVDSLSNSNFQVTLHYSINNVEWTKDFAWYSNNTATMKSYWRVSLENGTEISDNDVVSFYITATDYNGPIVNTNQSSPLTVTVGNATPPTVPGEVIITMVEGVAHLTWQEVAGATYVIESSASVNGTYSVIGNSSTNSFDDTSSPTYSKMFYRVRSVK